MQTSINNSLNSYGVAGFIPVTITAKIVLKQIQAQSTRNTYQNKDFLINTDSSVIDARRLS